MRSVQRVYALVQERRPQSGDQYPVPHVEHKQVARLQFQIPPGGSGIRQDCVDGEGNAVLLDFGPRAVHPVAVGLAGALLERGFLESDQAGAGLQ